MFWMELSQLGSDDSWQVICMYILLAFGSKSELLEFQLSNKDQFDFKPLGRFGDKKHLL